MTSKWHWSELWLVEKWILIIKFTAIWTTFLLLLWPVLYLEIISNIWHKKISEINVQTSHSHKLVWTYLVIKCYNFQVCLPFSLRKYGHHIHHYYFDRSVPSEHATSKWMARKRLETARTEIHWNIFRCTKATKSQCPKRWQDLY